MASAKNAVRPLPEITAVVERVFAGHPEHIVRWAKQMAVGMAATGSCTLTRIAEALREPLRPQRTIKRLSRNLLDERIDDDALDRRLLAEGTRYIDS